MAKLLRDSLEREGINLKSYTYSNVHWIPAETFIHPVYIPKYSGKFFYIPKTGDISRNVPKELLQFIKDKHRGCYIFFKKRYRRTATVEKVSKLAGIMLEHVRIGAKRKEVFKLTRKNKEFYMKLLDAKSQLSFELIYKRARRRIWKYSKGCSKDEGSSNSKNSEK